MPLLLGARWCQIRCPVDLCVKHLASAMHMAMVHNPMADEWSKEVDDLRSSKTCAQNAGRLSTSFGDPDIYSLRSDRSVSNVSDLSCPSSNSSQSQHIVDSSKEVSYRRTSKTSTSNPEGRRKFTARHKYSVLGMVVACIVAVAVVCIIVTRPTSRKRTASVVGSVAESMVQGNQTVSVKTKAKKIIDERMVSKRKKKT